MVKDKDNRLPFGYDTLFYYFYIVVRHLSMSGSGGSVNGECLT